MKSIKKILKIFLIALFWIGVWELVALTVNQELFVPSPVSVIKCGAKLFITASFWSTILNSVFRVFLGTLIAVILGIILALITSKYNILYDLFYPFLNIVKATPVASFITLVLIWMGSKRVPVFICALMVFPIIWSAVSDGIKAIDQKHKELAQVFSFSFEKRLRIIYLPTIAPYFLSAFKTSIGLAWKAGVAAEVLAVSPNSIGKELFNAKTYYEVPELFAWTITVIILSIALETLMSKLLHLIGKKYSFVRSYAENN